ncbi:cytochrome c oxidase subunit 4 isoform 1, mitochondrial-like [Pollicipes pollicipes]|uniref:cytochrome c oxidase subunit 4 isoform 1, mitochondrial-like n=1 Tax=Pollicipes pollicipes TaxID=41117 RepID=UPI0018854653|nr:cytochrome c oxidase subunit 4 isoform 1, mitochondrial-like [Pollicipes pollicipes]XP_037069402.1 cytochrome c oxidase subunit 4 isoform 1, mitochondrial-like [Pollicipes pollicipes]
MATATGTVLRRCGRVAVARLSTTPAALSGGGLPTVMERHGNRQVIGYGYNGEPNYMDRVDYPIPAVRFKEETPQIKALREKEKGDWKKLTPEEVQELYRATFCQSFAEMQAPTGEWKLALGGTLIACSMAIWVYLWMKVYVYDTMPDTITNPEKVEAQVQRMIDLRINPVEGVSSNWDYEKSQWKN